MLVSYGRCNKLPQSQWLKRTQVHQLAVMGFRSPCYTHRPTKLKSSCRQRCIPSGSQRGESRPGLLQHLQAACPPWLWVPSSIFNVSSVAVSDLTQTLHLLPPSYKGPCDDQTHPCNLESSSISSSLITSTRPLLPRKVTCSQVPGVKTWTSFGEPFFCLPQLAREVFPRRCDFK